MENKIEKALKTLTDKIDKDIVSGEALHFSQAVLNLTHALAQLADTKRQQR